MNKDAIIFWGSLFAWGIILAIIWSNIAKGCDSVNSFPVEEMYHRQLVVTLDSILDARFGAGCCEEDIDSDDVSIPQTLFHNRSSMEMME